METHQLQQVLYNSYLHPPSSTGLRYLGVKSKADRSESDPPALVVVILLLAHILM